MTGPDRFSDPEHQLDFITRLLYDRIALIRREEVFTSVMNDEDILFLRELKSMLEDMVLSGRYRDCESCERDMIIRNQELKDEHHNMELAVKEAADQVTRWRSIAEDNQEKATRTERAEEAMMQATSEKKHAEEIARDALAQARFARDLSQRYTLRIREEDR